MKCQEEDDRSIYGRRGQAVQDVVAGFNVESSQKEVRPPICWLQTHSGKKIDLLNPTSKMVDIEDIAHALSMICRFNGHCRDFYSVAEHSVMAEAVGCQIRKNERCSKNPLIPPRSAIEWARESLELLLHDAPEAYIGDLTTPLKRGLDLMVMGSPSPEMRISPIGELEMRWQISIGQAFGLGDRLANPSNLVQQADDHVLAIEVTTLFHPMHSCWWDARNRPRSGEMMIQCWSPAKARRQFIGRFRVLYETLYSKTGWGEVGEAGSPADEEGGK
jgi:hypothetical protein